MTLSREYGRERQYGGGDYEVQTIRYEISYKDILYNTANIL